MNKIKVMTSDDDCNKMERSKTFHIVDELPLVGDYSGIVNDNMVSDIVPLTRDIEDRTPDAEKYKYFLLYDDEGCEHPVACHECTDYTIRKYPANIDIWFTVNTPTDERSKFMEIDTDGLEFATDDEVINYICELNYPIDISVGTSKVNDFLFDLEIVLSAYVRGDV